MKRALIAAVLLAGCTDERRARPSATECDRYAGVLMREVAQLGDDATATRIRDRVLRECLDGTVSRRELDCVLGRTGAVACTADKAHRRNK